MYVCVCVYVSTLKATGHITKFGRWIVHDKSSSFTLFEVKRSNVKVGVSLHSSDCQFSSLSVLSVVYLYAFAA